MTDTLTSPLVDFTCGQWGSAGWAAERSHGDLRRHLWTAYAERRPSPPGTRSTSR
ncbi:hypothetical protein [Kribbella sp. NPDC004875]|uniref:hypothetical protein n=1 Tax=Kribbella sp. NPDC004875 TaxID=3364107 RepID=UPI003694BB86